MGGGKSFVCCVSSFLLSCLFFLLYTGSVVHLYTRFRVEHAVVSSRKENISTRKSSFVFSFQRPSPSSSSSFPRLFIPLFSRKEILNLSSSSSPSMALLYNFLSVSAACNVFLSLAHLFLLPFLLPFKLVVRLDRIQWTFTLLSISTFFLLGSISWHWSVFFFLTLVLSSIRSRSLRETVRVVRTPS